MHLALHHHLSAATRLCWFSLHPVGSLHLGNSTHMLLALPFVTGQWQLPHDGSPCPLYCGTTNFSTSPIHVNSCKKYCSLQNKEKIPHMAFKTLINQSIWISWSDFSPPLSTHLMLWNQLTTSVSLKSHMLASPCLERCLSDGHFAK